MSQCATILNHLQREGAITAMTAMQRYGVYRLAARIKDLRDKGHNIKTETVNRNGKSYAAYYLGTKHG